MSFELRFVAVLILELSSDRPTSRDLSFQYPGSQTVDTALDKVSFSIRAGQLVVVVGVNGSGKSTLIKVLSCMQNPTSPPGSILIDGQAMSEYRIRDLRQSIAMLTQDHTLFPLSLGENIGLGYVKKVEDTEAIRDAVELGGAGHCLAKLKDGLNTILDRNHDIGSHNISFDADNPLQLELAKLGASIALSGGERQRMIA